MNIRVGLIGHSHGWDQLFKQEGVDFELADLPSAAVNENFSVLVIARELSEAEGASIVHYLRAGGAVLACVRYLNDLPGISSRPARVDYLLPDEDSPFASLSILDLGIEGDIPREARTLRTQGNEFAVFAGELLGGMAVLAPFDPGALMSDSRTASKSFYSGRERLPAEHTSLVSKGEVRHFVHQALEYLHHSRGLPYVHLWWFPAGSENMVALRIDTDGAEKRDIDDLYTISRELEVGFTWFIDMKSHEEILPHFASMVEQELGVHCYEHQVYSSYEENLKQMSKAKSALEAVGVFGGGFAAPFGSWNPSLARAIDDLRFAYSSEFSYAYDAFPLYPAWVNTGFATLQIPIHPVCPGTLRQAGYSADAMRSYYSRVIDTKRRRRDPLFFYHHPSHRHWDVIRDLLQDALGIDCKPTTFGDYARWWKQRSTFRIAVELDGETLRIDDQSPAYAPAPEHLTIRVSSPTEKEAILPRAGAVRLHDLQWREVPQYRPPKEIGRIREFDPRAVLGQVYSAMKRRIR
ncbi:MAG: hypothetical protein KAJ12_11820 [Bacteroidetes bacterium]|nr:hypothetical protein [Bacteroidota bacterium]